MLKVARVRLVPIGLAMLLTTTGSATAADAVLETEPGFTRLDSGKDLSGWTGIRSPSMPGGTEGWSVRDGAIHCDAKLAKGHLYTQIAHSDNCVIRLQFRAAEKGDSGVYLHGGQFQIRDYKNVGPEEYAKHARPHGEWNDLEFDITKGLAVVKLNGQVIEKGFKLGEKPDQGLGLQREIGDFDFRFIRIHEK